MSDVLNMFLKLQRRRVRISMANFVAGVVFFAVSAFLSWQRDQPHLMLIFSGVMIWSISIVYHLHDVLQSLFRVLEEEGA